MDKPKHPFRLTAIVLAIAAIAAILLTRTPVKESVLRQSARLFDYEYIPNQNVDIDSCSASKEADSIYKDFRHKSRFHFQTMAMASYSDSSRIILLSDLPPHFETDSIAPIFAQFNHSTKLLRHRIGYDGYTTDMVITLANATRENCNRLIKRLNKELFFSEYKPTVMTLPPDNKRQYFAKDNIDYQISLDEFNTWFIGTEKSKEEKEKGESEGNNAEEGNDNIGVEQFISLSNTDSTFSVIDIFTSRARGVFFSHQPGFVAWALAKNNDIAPQIADIRQFTLDADLILGALADSNTLVIIGRERQSPLYELPPLQIESILLLASITEKELSQSLDINDLMAGKMNSGHDWCPTYLSRELENTEFGDLMTITDILLKDWSERGTIKESHYRYPEPGYYPFDQPLFRKLGLNELVYNWNTAGAMYAIDTKSNDNTVTIYTLGRTGSLPVSYFNSQERSQSIGYRYESQAYHYFATLGCTDLARVVQYTALYQLFIDNNISFSGNTYPSFPKNKPYLLYKPTVDLLNTIKNLSSEEITTIADSISQRNFRSFQKEHVDKQLRDNEQKYNFSYTDDNINKIYQNVHHDTRAGIGGKILETKNLLNSLSDDKFKELARYLAYPRGIKINSRETYNTYLQARKVNQTVREMGKNNLDLMGIDLANVKNFFSASLSSNSGRYMKTSSLIVTYNDMLTTGGHNISSKINRVSSMTNYKHSRNSYTPTDYRRENPAKEPDAAVEPSREPSDNAPKGNRPSSAKSKSKASAKPSANTGGKAAKPSSIRTRNSVISNAPRSSRGL